MYAIRYAISLPIEHLGSPLRTEGGGRYGPGYHRGDGDPAFMSDPEVFERMLASIHEATLDDSQWPAAAALIDRLCGSKGNILVFGQGASSEDVDIFFTRGCSGGERHEEAEREYIEVYHPHDERLPRLRQLPDSRVVPTAWLLSEEEMRTSRVFNELLVPGDMGNALHARLDGPNGSRIVWTSADPVDATGWSSGPVEMIERILPHVRQYVRVRHALGSARALGASLSDLLAHLSLAVIHLDRRRRMVDASDRARAVLARGDGLTYRDGALHASRCDDDERLQEVLARALPTYEATGAGGSVLVSRQHSVSRLVLHVSPVNGRGAMDHSGRVAALVLVVDPESRSSLDADRLAELFGLTGAESQIVAMLAEGMRITEIARRTGRSPTTVKWHVQHVFGKLGVARQTDLVRLVLSLGDIAGA